MNAGMSALALFAALGPAAAFAAEGASPAPVMDPAAAATAAKDAYQDYPSRLTMPGNVDRALAGHVFTPSILIRSPFAVTDVGADLLYGSGTATGPKPTVPVGGTDINRGEGTYTFALMGQNFYYDAKVADGVSVGGGLTVQFVSGIDGPSAVVLGLQVDAGLFGRLTAGREYGPVRAALTLDASYAPQYAIVVLDAILNRGNSALKEANAWNLKPGVALAYAPHRSVGITVSADYQALWLDTTASGWQYESAIDTGIAVDLDVGTLTTVPVSVIGSFRGTIPVGAEDVSSVIDYTLGVFYTGRPPLVVGVELGQRLFRITGLDATANIAQLKVQYLW
jgi:hypothetical protein